MKCEPSVELSNNFYLSGAALWSGGALVYLLQRSGVLASSWKPRARTLFCVSGVVGVAGIVARVIRIKEENRRIAFAKHFFRQEGKDRPEVEEMFIRPFTSAEDRNQRLLAVANAMLEPNGAWERLIKELTLNHDMLEFVYWDRFFFLRSLHDVAIEVKEAEPHLEVLNQVRYAFNILPAPSTAARPYLEDDLRYIACVLSKLRTQADNNFRVVLVRASPGVSNSWVVKVAGMPLKDEKSKKLLTPVQYYKVWCKQGSQ